MASNYNKVPRPPVVFVADGRQRVVVRRETPRGPAPARLLSASGSRRRRPASTTLDGRDRVTGSSRPARLRQRGRRPRRDLSTRDGEAIAARTGVRLELGAVAVRSTARERRSSGPHRACSPTTPAAVVADPDVDVVVEVIGGIEPARDADPRRPQGRQAGRHRQQGAHRQRRHRAVRGRAPAPASTCCSRRRSAGASRSSARCGSRSPASASGG